MTIDRNEFCLRPLSDRIIDEYRAFGHVLNVSPGAHLEPISMKSLSGNGRPVASEHTTEVSFTGGENSYQIRLDIGEGLVGNGVSARIRLRNWTSVRYLAIGYTHENAFRHVKIANPAHERWADYAFGHRDIAFGLQNQWNLPGDAPIRDIRFYIRGTPDPQGSFLDLEYAACWRESESSPEWIVKCGDRLAIVSDVIDSIYSYVGKCFTNFSAQAESFMLHGKCPLDGDVSLDWPLTTALPTALGDVGTYRFSWHALHPVIMLLLHARHTKQLGPIFAARDLVTDWINRSYLQPDKDKKFAWYDHGTAERQLALIMMWYVGHEQRFDVRFMERLKLVIFRQGQLLASEVFYASHQPIRYHNHAWFQDIALLATVPHPVFRTQAGVMRPRG